MLQLIRQCFNSCLNRPRTFTSPNDLGERKHTIEQIIPSFLENKIDSLTYCIYLYTYKNTAVHSFPQRQEKQPGPFSRLDGKVSHSPVLPGCYKSPWHFCFLSKPDAGGVFFYFLCLGKRLSVLGTLPANISLPEIYICPIWKDAFCILALNLYSNWVSQSLIYSSSNWATLHCGKAVQVVIQLSSSLVYGHF